MPINKWRGDAAAVADVWTLTFTGPATGSGTVAVPIGTKTVSVAFVNAETAATVASRMNDALNNSDILEFLELGYVLGGAVVTATMKNAGVPTLIGAPVVTGGVGIGCTQANTVAATGPNFGDNAKNWSLLTKPGVTLDDVVIDGGPPILYGLATMFAGNVNSIRVPNSFTQSWGLPRRNNSGGGDGYIEFRQTFVDFNTCGGPPLYIGEGGVGQGGGLTLLRGKLALGQLAYVYATGVSSEDGAPAVDFGQHGTDAPGRISCFGGSVGWGVTLDTAAVVVPLFTVTAGTAYVYGYATAVKCRGGDTFSRGYNPTVEIQGGTFTQQAGRVDSVTADGGTVRFLHDQGTNVITVVFRGSIQGEPPVLDLTSNDRSGRKLARGSSFTGGAFIMDPFKTANIDHVVFDQQSYQASLIGRTIIVTRPADGSIMPSMSNPLGLQATTLAASGNGQGVSFDGYSMELTAVQVASNDLSAATSTLVTKLQEADTLGGSYTDIPGAVFSGIGHADIQPHAEAITFKRTKEFIRPVFTVTGGSFDIFTVGLAVGQ